MLTSSRDLHAGDTAQNLSFPSIDLYHIRTDLLTRWSMLVEILAEIIEIKKLRFTSPYCLFINAKSNNPEADHI